MEKMCLCGTSFYCPKSLSVRKKYCSKKCFYEYRKTGGWNKGLVGLSKPNSGSFKKGSVPWNKGTRGLSAPWNKGLKGTHFSPVTEFKKGQNAWNKGLPHMLDEEHPQWKADAVQYGALHSWVKRKLGKADCCKNQGCVYPRTNAAKKILSQPTAFQWANISHEYKRELSDWIQLCASCHVRYDRGLITLEL